MEHESCRYLLDSLSDYVDGELRTELCAEIDRHLEHCDNCRIVIDSLRKTVYLYHATAEPPIMPDEVRERLFTRLDLSDYMNHSG